MRNWEICCSWKTECIGFQYRKRYRAMRNEKMDLIDSEYYTCFNTASGIGLCAMMINALLKIAEGVSIPQAVSGYAQWLAAYQGKRSVSVSIPQAVSGYAQYVETRNKDIPKLSFNTASGIGLCAIACLSGQARHGPKNPFRSTYGIFLIFGWPGCKKILKKAYRKVPQSLMA